MAFLYCSLPGTTPSLESDVAGSLPTFPRRDATLDGAAWRVIRRIFADAHGLTVRDESIRGGIRRKIMRSGKQIVREKCKCCERWPRAFRRQVKTHPEHIVVGNSGKMK